jgi:putative ATP-binding cassette transporter
MNIFPPLAEPTSLSEIENLGLSLSQRSGETRLRQSRCRGSDWNLEGGCLSSNGRDGDFILGLLTSSWPEDPFRGRRRGSGKSTLAKLVVGLYSPEGGEIRLDERPITDQNRESYRQHFSVVFSDFYLFEDLLGLESPSLDQRARDYLSLLELEHKVQVKNGGLSTTALSQGQRRRLALLTAYLEDRPIYVFDEWAADQDPQYKKVFYTQLLPELKARGKGVIVITHDDRYFDLADRIFKLDYGKPVIQCESPTAVLPDYSSPQYRKLAP